MHGTDSDGIITTGTTTVGLVGADGVVLAADSRASLGGRFVTNRTARKVVPVDDRTALTFAGSVGDAQSFVRRLRAELALYDMDHEPGASVDTAATVAADLIRRDPSPQLELVLGGVAPEPTVYQIDPAGGVMDAPIAASGSGMQLAYGYLEDAYDPEQSVAELRAVAAMAVRNATERDTASGDGMTIATITADELEREQYDGIERAVSAATTQPADSEVAR
ncbi:20S proteasome subunits A and B [Natrialba taiwanensis]|uniref:proteasome endopeptidase complex n=1 Tax=Natrialba taiwanensis DSM 12281 TaxID=1230458 RepID=M0AAY2_9EURY|nr:20S proteasome subunits A and B [Natrialba taiwanensis]ELY95920.1 20S proteasome subunits A and B [Natrialba taiwanensis DSM 12281]